MAVIGGNPEAEGDGVGCGGVVADTQFRSSGTGIADRCRLHDLVLHRSRRSAGCGHFEERSGAGARFDGGQGGGDRYCDSTCHRIRMGMSYFRRCGSFGDNPVQVVGEPSAQRCDPHRSAITPGSLAIPCLLGEFPPVVTLLADQPQDPTRPRTVSPVDVVVLRERPRQCVLIDPPALSQHGEDGARHLRVIGPQPRPRQDPAFAQRSLIHRILVARPERISQRQALQ
ncbi:hypothetical protein LTV02_16170 [Nocardia yamanashiensis]|nr:hypothetical protein [Nocardia yamanashiensis]UGT44832.1 hypothetical protein LTV02_16170 [Nocardia yamanashiensis]